MVIADWITVHFYTLPQPTLAQLSESAKDARNPPNQTYPAFRRLPNLAATPQLGGVLLSAFPESAAL
jgi:hypothetical protein